MFVRTASKGDIQSVHDLLAETICNLSTPARARHAEKMLAFTPGTMGAWLEQPKGEFLVSDDGKQLGGMVYAMSDTRGTSVTVHHLYIRPSLQRRGVGSMLLEEILESFPEATHFYADVDGTNEKAIGFLRRYGFKIVDEKPSDLAAWQGTRMLLRNG